LLGYCCRFVIKSLKGIIMSENKLPASFKVCATCGLWGGSRSADFGGYSRFEQDQQGKCYGGGFNQANMSPMASCSKWEVWPAIR
jgi:hypothetical protein